MRKALTLVETMVATIIASMLLFEVGTSFLMFRQMNNESISDTKSQLKILEIEDFITNNIDKFIDKQLGKSYFRVDYDKVGSNYDFSYGDGVCFLTPGSGAENYETICTGENRACTINSESIIAFSLLDDYRDQPIYLITDEGNKQVTKLSPSDTLYYAGLNGDETFDDNLIEYNNGILKFNGDVIFTELPFTDLNVKLQFEKPDVDTYTVARVSESDSEYTLLPFTVKASDPNCGMITIEDVNTEEGTCKLVAHNFIYDSAIEEIDSGGGDDEEETTPKETEGEDSEGEGTEDETEEYDEEGNLIKEIIKVFTFEGWDNGSDEFEYEIDYKNEPGKEYIANFSNELIEITILEDSDDIEEEEEAAENMLYAVEGSLKNTTVTKKVYVLKCNITYTDKNGTLQLPFVAGLFEKYLPEIYRGE